MTGVSRRGLLAAGLAGALAPAATLRVLGAETATAGEGATSPNPSPVTHRLTFEARERIRRILGPGGPDVPLWTYSDEDLPVLRIRQGDSLAVTLKNELSEHTSIHWHGIRVPNAMDGVQYLTQPPVNPGESFVYTFTPPDTGSFFFHPHCNESGQVGHGLVGLLIVEGDETVPSAADIVLAVKDWRLDDDGRFLPFTTDAGAGRAGTFGTRRGVNNRLSETIDVPGSSDVRVRLYNVDATRVMQVGIEGGEAAVIAIDGNPCTPFMLDKRGLDVWLMGPAQRLDLRVRTAATGGTVSLIDYFASEPWTIATLRSTGADAPPRPFDLTPLRRATRAEPDLSRAEPLSFTFSAASEAVSAVLDAFKPDDPLAEIMLDSLCVADKTFWAINRMPWPNDAHRNLPPPLYTLEAGRTYVATLMNATPHPHPVHLHGMTFRVLSASRKVLPVHDADTVLLGPKERIEIAFVAAPGLWMLHCHILEHLEYGMMGYLKVV